MTPIEITLQILGLVVSFVGGCWVGKSRCHMAFEVDTADDRDGWFNKSFPCMPKAPSWRQSSTDSNHKAT